MDICNSVISTLKGGAMRNDCIQFEFIGFDPEYEVRNFISTVAEKLYLSSPSDSAIKVAMKVSRGVIQASCRIVSHAGTFMAEAISDNPIKAIKKVEKKIAEQLEGWKHRRFLNEGSGVKAEELV
jgi:ribosome-associated translation inhibitor RaiA